MVILCLTSTPVFGGPEKYVINMSEGLKNRGHTIVVASSRNNLNEFKSKKIKTYPLFIGPKLAKRNVIQLIFSPLMLIYLLIKIYYINSRENIDIIYATYKKEQIIGVIVSKILKIPIIWREAGPLPNPISNNMIWRFFYRCFADRTSKIIATSNIVLESLINVGVQNKKLSVLYTGINTDLFVPKIQSEIKKKSATIGIIARLSGLKGHENLIKSMTLIIKKIPKAKLLIIGDGPSEVILKKLVNDLNLNDNIEFVGHVDDVIGQLHRMDIFVLPSVGEGLPISIIEAMACGLPIVATNVGAISELVNDGKSGFLLNNSSYELISDKIIEILSDNKIIRKMGLKSREKAVKYFGHSNWVKNLDIIFKSVVKV